MDQQTIDAIQERVNHSLGRDTALALTIGLLIATHQSSGEFRAASKIVRIALNKATERTVNLSGSETAGFTYMKEQILDILDNLEKSTKSA